MQIGDRFIEGLIKKREEARKIYEKAKRQGKKTALLEQQRPNIFTNSVANIGPGETIIIQIEYQHTVAQTDGIFSVRFPMVVAPRYSPKPIVQSVDFTPGKTWGRVSDPVPDREKIESPVLDPAKSGKINPVSLRVVLNPGFQLGDVVSHHHQIVRTIGDNGAAVLTLSDQTTPADRDFELTWEAKTKAPTAALFKEDVDGSTYYLAYVTPPTIDVSKLPKQNRETIFVVDNSGSMAGASMVQAKAALLFALNRLSPNDRFNIIRFDNTMELLFLSAVPADRENIGVALRFVGNLSADGGTEMLPALKAALIDSNPSDTKHVRQVIFLTDGAIGNELQMFNEIEQNRGRSRIFTVGIGSAPNSHFMTRAAEIGRGTFTHVGSEAQVKTRMVELFRKLENPVMVNLTAQLHNETKQSGTKSEITPDPLPDLYIGEPVLLFAKIDSTQAPGTLQISGQLANQPWQVDMKLAGATSGTGIGKLWARRKIATLEASRTSGISRSLADAMIVDTALKHHLVSRLTSLVAVDVTPSRPKGQPLGSNKMPLNLPAGWVFDKVYGEKPAPDQKAQIMPAQKIAMTLVAAAPTAKAASIVAARTRSLTLPKTATMAERNIMVGLLLLFLAAMLLLSGRLLKGISRDLGGVA